MRLDNALQAVSHAQLADTVRPQGSFLVSTFALLVINRRNYGVPLIQHSL
jgi:hypothetical protein